MRRLLHEPVLAGSVRQGRLVGARISQKPGAFGSPLILEHDRLPFINYPHEWTPSMLAGSGHLTLDLAEALLPRGWRLKDATPYNVVFDGPRPVFVDWGSFEERPPGDAVWLACSQFQQTFLLPLEACRHAGLTLRELFTESREGLSPDSASRLVPLYHRLAGSGLMTITLPRLLSGLVRAEHYERPAGADPEFAAYALERLFSRLRQSLGQSRAPGEPRATGWQHYMAGRRAVSYSEEGFSGKAQFVEQILQAQKPASVLDAGCNTGFFSCMAARAGASVVACDEDAAVVDSLFRRAASASLNILPLHINLARPSPPLGWENSENFSFLDRASERFDLMLMLALVHHLAITERVPLNRIFQLAARLTRRHLVIEYVGPGDPMFQSLLRGRQHLHAGWSKESFEAAAAERFHCRASRPVEGQDRSIYLLERK